MEGSIPKAPPMTTSSERKARPQKDQALNCPRCNSTNTKFCYYNNYSLSQPRYFCKTCRRYWTEGGSLRNVPVGGGSRKNKRSSASNSASSTSSSNSSANILSKSTTNKLIPDLAAPPPNFSASQNPKIHQGQDLNLAYPPPSDHDYTITNSISKFIEFPYSTTTDHHQDKSTTTHSSSHHQHQLSHMELLKSGIASSRGLGSFMPMSMTSDYGSSGFGLQEFKPPGLSFSLEGFENGYGGISGIQEGGGNSGGGGGGGGGDDGGGARVLFPMEDLKQVPSSTDNYEQNRSHHHADSTGYWNGMLGGGTW